MTTTPTIMAPAVPGVKLTRPELAALNPDAARTFALWAADRALCNAHEHTASWLALHTVLGGALRLENAATRRFNRRPGNWDNLTSAAYGVDIPLPPPKGTAPVMLHLVCYYAKQAVMAAVYRVCDATQLETVCDYAAWAAGSTTDDRDASHAAMQAEYAALRREYERLLDEARQGRSAA